MRATETENSIETETITHNGIKLVLAKVGAPSSFNASPVYPVVFNFNYRGRQKSEQLTFMHPIDVPRRDEVVSLRFNDFGQIHRITASVEYAIYEYYGQGTVTGIDAGMVLQIMLHGVTDQPV